VEEKGITTTRTRSLSLSLVTFAAKSASNHKKVTTPFFGPEAMGSSRTLRLFGVLATALLVVAQVCVFSKEWKYFFSTRQDISAVEESAVESSSSSSSRPARPHLEKKLTALISVYKQPRCLKLMIDHLRTCPLIAEIRVNWFEENAPPPPPPDDGGLFSNYHSIPVKFDRLENKISHRFLPREFTTDAIFSLDVDVFYSCESLELAYATWNASNNTAVGFHPRNMKEESKYSPGESYQGPEFPYNTVFITKGGIVHKDIFQTYFEDKFRDLREQIDEHNTGEDILMSFILASERKADVVNICLAAHHTCPVHCHEGSLGSLNQRTRRHRWPLIQNMFTVFGGNPFTLKQGAGNMIWQQQPSEQARDFCYTEGTTAMLAYCTVCLYGQVCPRKLVPIPANGLLNLNAILFLFLTILMIYLLVGMRRKRSLAEEKKLSHKT
jgi:hypothetical protein